MDGTFRPLESWLRNALCNDQHGPTIETSSSSSQSLLRIAVAANLPVTTTGSSLALFDLDHTLLPIDSDYEWGSFLVRIGILNPEHQAQENERFYRQYQDGTLNMVEYLDFALRPLASRPRVEVEGWHARYMNEVVRPQIRPEAIELVQLHQAAGHLCAVVTATNSFVTRPIAAALGVSNLIATEVEEIDGAYTGRPKGIPSFREGKIHRLEQWLTELGTSLDQFERSWFYSDSMNDMPLLKRVTNPVATNPDPRLAAVAKQVGWPILQLFS
jgi:HAD superfamily hydrolase (TIGR01490 family)